MSGRDARIDVAKGVLIILVVIGHFLEISMGRSIGGDPSGWSYEPQRFLLTTIYLAHIPLFVFLVGTTAKSDHLPERIARLLVLGVTLHVGYVVALRIIAGHWVAQAWTSPYWVLWFIASMIWWMLALPLIERAPRCALGLSVLGVAVVGMAPLHGNIAAYSRTVVYLPFFILGHLYGRRLVHATGRLSAYWRAAAAAGLIALALLVWRHDIDPHWIFGNQTFEQLSSGTLAGVVTRLELLVLTLAAALCLLCLIPAGSRLFETPGRHSLSIFLLHPIAVLAYQRIDGPWGPGTHDSVTQAIVAIALALLVVTVLTATIFDRALRRYSGGVAARLVPARR